MKLNEISDNKQARKNRTRVGRGSGSGSGKTAGRGQKGQRARNTVRLGFEGGQMPLYRRLPKRGFVNIFAKKFVEVNLDDLQKSVEAGRIKPEEKVDAEVLQKAGFFKKPHDGVRLLGRGALSVALNLEVAGASAAAVEAVQKLGGSVTITVKSAQSSQKEAEA